MSFTSPLFVIFLSVALPVYHALRRSERGYGRTLLFLALSSALFYTVHNPIHFPLLAGLSLLTFLMARTLPEGGGESGVDERRGRRRVALYAFLLLTPLLIFKYTDFFFSLLNRAGLPLSVHLHPALPLGISFFTFQNISYITDVFRGTFRKSRSFLKYFLYISFFPQLVAGPIVTAREFLPSLERESFFHNKEIDWRGALFLLLSGYYKKGVLADTLSLVVDPVYGNSAHQGGGALLVATLAYTLQIYFDFSGYSDMALGLGRLFGFHLPENFRFPYSAVGFRDFWRRWHITLSVWLRDHIYIPLGGSRNGAPRLYLSLLATMVLGGLWHGAHENYLFWGFGHGLLLVLERQIPRSWYEGRFFRISFRLLTFLIVALLWVPFRAASLLHGFETALLVYQKIFTWAPGAIEGLHWKRTLLALFLLGVGTVRYGAIERRFHKLSPFGLGVVSGLLFLLWFALSPGGEPFIYFVF